MQCAFVMVLQERKLSAWRSLASADDYATGKMRKEDWDALNAMVAPRFKSSKKQK
jgi:hypothetical protein